MTTSYINNRDSRPGQNLAELSKRRFSKSIHSKFCICINHGFCLNVFNLKSTMAMSSYNMLCEFQFSHNATIAIKNISDFDIKTTRRSEINVWKPAQKFKV